MGANRSPGADSVDHYAVMGDPIAHSRSPEIHTRFAAACGHAIAYGRVRVEPGCLAGAVAAFRAGGGCGLNVTVPHKEQAFALADMRSPRATRAGAANTLWFDGDSVHADNTDGIGLRRDLEGNLGLDLHGRRVLLLGAGGAARGVLEPLLGAGPATLLIANRDAARARALAGAFADLGPVHACALGRLGGAGAFDLLVNATSASLGGEALTLPASIVAPGATAYDMSYGAAATPFGRWCARHGAGAVHDGLGMLVEQAAEAFRIWRGLLPATAPVISAIRALLAEAKSL